MLCPRCKKRKRAEKSKGRLAAYCRQCERSYQAEYRERNRERKRAYDRQRAADIAADPKRRAEQRAYQRERMAAWRAKYPELVKASTKRRWRRDKANPVKHQRRLEDMRIYYRLRKGGNVPHSPRAQKLKDRTDRVPSEPFMYWLKDAARKHGSVSELAARTGVPERSLRRILSGQENVSLALVDQALINEGSTTLRELYP